MYCQVTGIDTHAGGDWRRPPIVAGADQGPPAPKPLQAARSRNRDAIGLRAQRYDMQYRTGQYVEGGLASPMTREMHADLVSIWSLFCLLWPLIPRGMTRNDQRGRSPADTVPNGHDPLIRPTAPCRDRGNFLERCQ